MRFTFGTFKSAFLGIINEKHLSKAAEDPAPAAPAAAMPAAGGEYVAPAHTVGEMPTFETTIPAPAVRCVGSPACI